MEGMTNDLLIVRDEKSKKIIYIIHSNLLHGYIYIY
jgi:hypothetical protein